MVTRVTPIAKIYQPKKYVFFQFIYTPIRSPDKFPKFIIFTETFFILYFKFVSSIFVKCIFQSYLFEIWLEIALKIWEIYRLQKVENKWISVYEVLKGCSWVTLTQMNHVYTFLNMKVTLWEVSHTPIHSMWALQLWTGPNF